MAVLDCMLDDHATGKHLVERLEPETPATARTLQRTHHTTAGERVQMLSKMCENHPNTSRMPDVKRNLRPCVNHFRSHLNRNGAHVNQINFKKQHFVVDISF